MTDNFLLINSINDLGKGVIHPNGTDNFTKVNESRINYIVSQGEIALPYIKDYIDTPKSFDGLIEALFVVDKMADNKVSGLETLYPTLSKYNNSDCPEIQTMLSGIYRKTLVPDAFGPLCRMLYKQVTNPPQGLFDASEETGGAILEYLRSYGAVKAYPVSEKTKKINPIPLENNPLKYSQKPLNYRPIQPYSNNGLRI